MNIRLTVPLVRKFRELDLVGTPLGGLQLVRISIQLALDCTPTFDVPVFPRVRAEKALIQTIALWSLGLFLRENHIRVLRVNVFEVLRVVVSWELILGTTLRLDEYGLLGV